MSTQEGLMFGWCIVMFIGFFLPDTPAKHPTLIVGSISSTIWFAVMVIVDHLEKLPCLLK